MELRRKMNLCEENEVVRCVGRACGRAVVDVRRRNSRVARRGVEVGNFIFWWLVVVSVK